MQLVQSVAWPASTFAVFAHCPYHTRSLSIAAYHNNTHCPHHFKPQSRCCLPISCVLWVRTLSPPSGPVDPWYAPQSHPRMMMAPTFSFFILLVIIATKHNNATLVECNFFFLEIVYKYVTLSSKSTYYFHFPLPMVFLATIGLLAGHGGVSSLHNIEILLQKLTVYMSLFT